jgi:hypothetical protein
MSNNSFCHIWGLILFLLISNQLCAQKKGFESLAFAKTSLESIVKQYGSDIPDSSKVYKEYYLPISKQYNQAKASYAAYLGAMKDCILENDGEKKIKKCLQKQTLDIKKNLDSLQALFDNAYLFYYIEHPTPSNAEIKPHNTGVITAATITSLISALIDAGIKIWDEIQKKNKQFKDDYLTNIGSKDYVLGDFDDLVKQGSAKK